ncbi:MAG: 6-carboxytetrahydropterin synthase [Prolixibacteraceae bacterium]|jgi:6-pyruvoyltetrahydropterin/6-carboxytetrahydropterin synthase|nr:6-carboxytetrahydropterin synthase [Prolixibacteraceae bacterium]
MAKFQSTKVFDGFSTVFRQWRATDSHCKYLHGYGVSFKLWFEGDLDHRNWVWDFGGMKRAKSTIDGMSPKDWMAYMFDHTTIVSEDDPDLELFKQLDKQGLIQLRIMPHVGAERYAEYIYQKMNPFILKETNNRVRITQVEFREHERNSAIFIPE